MAKIAVWCRHVGDNIIGIGADIPWKILSDFKRFRRITEGQALVAGEKTYESFPNRTLPNRSIYVLTFNLDYEVSDSKNHTVVNDINEFKDFEGDLYIAGGASIYKAFMFGPAQLIPDIIVDSMYKGTFNPDLQGVPVDISPCVEMMEQKYRKISAEYELDNVTTTVWIKKGVFVDQAVIRKIINAIENNGEG